MKKEIISSCCAFGTDGTEDVHVLVEDCPIKRKDTQRTRNKYLSVPEGRENPVLHECQCIYRSGYHGGVHMIPTCEHYQGTKKVKREGRTRYKVMCAALEKQKDENELTLRDLDGMKTGTVLQKGKRKRTFLGIDAMFVYYRKPSSKDVVGESTPIFLKWLKGATVIKED